MNHKQLIVMWVAITMIGLMCLFPPWIFKIRSESSDINITAPGPYRLVFFGPPPIPTDSSIKEEKDTIYLFKKYRTQYWRPELDWTRILFPIAVVIIVAGGLMVTFRDRKPPSV